MCLMLIVFVSVLQDYVGLRGVFALLCAVLTLPVFGLLAFTFVPPLISTIWLGITYSFAAVSINHEHTHTHTADTKDTIYTMLLKY